MELKEQVCSLESAKRLKELGVKQESFFYWYRWTDTFNRHFGELPDEKDNNILGAPSIQPVPLSGITDRFSAFTVAELLNMLQEIKKCEIIIPLIGNVADYLAGEIINEKDSKKN